MQYCVMETPETEYVTEETDCDPVLFSSKIDYKGKIILRFDDSMASKYVTLCSGILERNITLRVIPTTKY